MRRFIILCLLAVAGSVSGLGSASARAKENRRAIEVAELEVVRTGGNAVVRFTLRAGERSTPAGSTLVVEPVIRGGGKEVKLPVVAVRRWAGRVADARHDLGAGRDGRAQAAFDMAAGGSLAYNATVPYESWMDGARLDVAGVSVACRVREVRFGERVSGASDRLAGANASGASSGAAEQVAAVEPVVQAVVAPAVVAPVVAKPAVVAQPVRKIVELHKFVAPADQFEQLVVLMEAPSGARMENHGEVMARVVDETREGSTTIHFGQSLSTVDRGFGDNAINMDNLIEAVNAVNAASDADLVAIMIVGTTSPEGGTRINEGLAWDRANAVKNFIAANTDVDPAFIRTFNGGTDWVRLRRMVEESNMPQKQRVLDIIDNVPIWSPRRNIGRLGTLMKLDGGRPYKYMFEHFFPRLRQAAYIKIYYDNK
ncbi:MAG: hypothetical protein LBV18_04355 [Alistipes sp.]|jgi:outer membrane protein OmpA-like peptidoglycan-associated protein|nr:hypothetical protein [Alistipes sp.]